MPAQAGIHAGWEAFRSLWIPLLGCARYSVTFTPFQNAMRSLICAAASLGSA